MPTVTLSLDIDCTKPSWSQKKEDQNYWNPPSYRLILNDEFLSERTWPPAEIFPNFLIRETMPVELEIRRENRLKLVPLLEHPSQAKFTVSNLMLNSKQLEYKHINDHELVFKL